MLKRSDLPRSDLPMTVMAMLKPFMPKLIYVEPRALDYPLGKELVHKFEQLGLDINGH